MIVLSSSRNSLEFRIVFILYFYNWFQCCFSPHLDCFAWIKKKSNEWEGTNWQSNWIKCQRSHVQSLKTCVNHLQRCSKLFWECCCSCLGRCSTWTSCAFFPQECEKILEKYEKNKWINSLVFKCRAKSSMSGSQDQPFFFRLRLFVVFWKIKTA